MLIEKSFTTGPVTLNYAEGPASGPPLVLLHGVMTRWQAFLPLIPDLSMRWQIFALDFRGHGKSSRMPGQYRLNDFVDDTVAFLEQQIHEPAVLFGHSLGGIIAAAAAARLPHSVRALVIGDSPLDPEDFQKSRYPKLFAAMRDIAASGRSVREMASAMADIRVTVLGVETPIRLGSLPGSDEAFLLFYAKCLSQFDPEVITMFLDGRALEGFDPAAAIRQLNCPVLLLQASSLLGGLMSGSDLKQAQLALSKATHVRFETLGHLLHLQHKEPVLRAVSNFLESLER